jgi:hypothetical protein
MQISGAPTTTSSHQPYLEVGKFVAVVLAVYSLKLAIDYAGDCGFFGSDKGGTSQLNSTDHLSVGAFEKAYTLRNGDSSPKGSHSVETSTYYFKSPIKMANHIPFSPKSSDG